MLLVKVGFGLVAAGTGVAVAASGGTVAQQLQQAAPPQQAVVSILGDANSFDVRVDGPLTHVRLANTTAPSPAAPGQQGQCLGAEAAAFLASMMPVGTPLKLTYGTDRFGRNLAAATTPDGKLLNAELARGGFAEVTAAGPGSATDPGIRPAVEAAARDAAVNKRGLYSPAIACTVPGQVKTVLDTVARVPAAAPPGARGADLHNAADSATVARAAADELLWAFQQNRQDIHWRVLDQATKADLEQQVTKARDQAAAAEVTLRNAASAAFNQEATTTSERAELARIAKRQAAIQAAESRRAALAARRAEAARQARAAAAKAARDRSDSNRNSRRSESGRSDSNRSRGDSDSSRNR